MKHKNKKSRLRCLIGFALLSVTAVALLSCQANPDNQHESEDNSMISYESAAKALADGRANAVKEAVTEYAAPYMVKRDEPYDEQSNNAMQKASYGYTLMQEQGYNRWKYVYSTDAGATYADMTWSDADSAWMGGNGAMSEDIMAAAGDTLTAREYTNKSNRTAKISGEVTLLAGKSAEIFITKNGEQIFPKDGGTLLLENGNAYIEVESDMADGDVLRFVLCSEDGAAVRFNPSIHYGLNKADRLHFLPEDVGFSYNWFGDLHPYWYDGKMYMYHLYHDGTWFQTSFMMSENMITYKEGGVKEGGMGVLGASDPNADGLFFSAVGGQKGEVYISFSENLLNWAYKPENLRNGVKTYAAFIDQEVYPYNGRDPFIFYDPDIDRYRITVMAYRNGGEGSPNQDRSIVIFTSDDSSGTIWTTPAMEMIRFPNHEDGDPECSMMMKIGDRWYLFTSRAIGEVGGLSYWFGEPGQTIDEIDWQSLPEHRLGGRSPKAAQLVKVNGKIYVYGWMASDGNKAWGGYINLPHEVFAKEDGTLGLRFDPCLVELLNHGMLQKLDGLKNAEITDGNFTVGENGSITSDGQGASMLEFKRTGHESSTYIEGTIHIPAEGLGGGLSIRCNGKLYTVRLYRSASEGGFKFSIGCPEETNNPYTEVNIGEGEFFDLKIVIDGSVIEAVVNDEWCICTNTTIKADKEITLGLAAWGSGVTFSDVTINKLPDTSIIFD